jgi:hypothetical protein
MAGKVTNKENQQPPASLKSSTTTTTHLSSSSRFVVADLVHRFDIPDIMSAKILEINDHNIFPWACIQKPVVTYDIVSYILQKSSVSKFVCIIANCFYHLNFTIFIADVIFDVEIGTLFEIKNY